MAEEEKEEKMLMNKSGSYYEEYRRSRVGQEKKNLSGKKLEEERLLTDRAAYITFLEVQLERVSAACLTSQSFSERIEQVQSGVVNFEEKLHNLQRTVKQLENVSDAKTKGWQDDFANLKERFKVLQEEFDAVTERASLTTNAADSVRKAWEGFELGHKQQFDKFKHLIEQRLLEMTSRLELEEARGRSTESKVSGLGELTREETKACISSVQNQMDVKLNAVKEQHDMRISSLETRIESLVHQFKQFHALHEGGGGGTLLYRSPGAESEIALRVEEEMGRVRVDLANQNEKNVKRMLETLQTLERRVERSEQRVGETRGEAQEKEKDSSLQVKKLFLAVSNLTKRLSEMEASLTSTRQENELLRQELERRTVHGGDAQDLFVRIGALEAALQTQQATAPRTPSQDDNDHQEQQRSSAKDTLHETLEAAMEEQRERFEHQLGLLDAKVRTQERRLSESMTRMDHFMDVFNATQDELMERLAQGKEHQARLSKMIEESASSLEIGQSGLQTTARSPSPFKLAFDELNEIVQAMSKSKSNTKKSKKSQKEKSSSTSRRSTTRAKTTRTSHASSEHKTAKKNKTRKGTSQSTFQTPPPPPRRARSRSASRSRSLSAEPRKKSYEQSTRSSQTRQDAIRRSRTPPPQTRMMDATTAEGTKGSTRSPFWNPSSAQRSGGKKGRDRASMETSASIHESLRDPTDQQDLEKDPLLFAGSHTESRDPSRPPWNASASHPLNRARSASTSSSSGYSSAEEALETKLSASGRSRRERLKDLYKELSQT